MRKIICVLVIFILIPGLSHSQTKKDKFEKGGGKIERLEKIKLIETLELDEETTLRFFSRRAEHRRTMHSLQQDADNKLKELETATQNANISDKELQKLLSEYLQIEQKIVNERNSFISSLNGILNYRQLCSLLVFEKKFREELRDVILRERQRRRN